MADFTKHDLEMLRHYASTDNRELYFNYLAQMEGSDGYGTLALGVVRNDNAPGATANNFARAQGGDKALHMGERGWQKVGEDLIEQDFILREGHFNNQRPDLALNLPVRDVQLAHDRTFALNGIKNEAWTPRPLLEAARRHGGEPEAEKVWSTMLDNQYRGGARGIVTLKNIAHDYNDETLNASSYFNDMASARGKAAPVAIPNTDPDRVTLGNTSYVRSEDGQWLTRTHVEGRISRDLPVTNTWLLEQLNDAREVRLERQQLRSQFHPDDQNQHRPIKESPSLLTDAGPDLDPRDPFHPRHALHQQCVAGVQSIDARLGKPWDAHSECMAASLTTLAARNNLDRVDHALLSEQGTRAAPGEYVFVVQGDLNDPAQRRAHMPTAEAIATPPEQSFQQLAHVDQTRSQEQAQQQTRDQEQTMRAPMMS